MPKKKVQKKKSTARKPPVPDRPKEFLDLIAPAAVKFNTDHYILGGSYRCVMMLRSYPPSTEELALLRRLGELGGVTLHLDARQVTAAEENAILHAATNKSRMERSNLSNMKQSVTAEAKLQDVVTLITNLRREQEPLLHCSVFIELAASSQEQLRALRDQVNAWLIRSKLGSDPLLLRQRDGFLSVNPAGQNVFGSFAERVLPASSVANLYPMSYSGKTDPGGFYLGKEKFGSNIIVDLDRRTGDKTNANVLILGNSGQGKSYLLKFLLCNVLETGKSVMGTYIPFTTEEKERAASVDLEEFLRQRGEKLLPSGREKRLASDHSITIRGSEWYDHEEHEGGNAISFVRRRYGFSYPEAVEELLGRKNGVVYPAAQKTETLPKPFG